MTRLIQMTTLALAATTLLGAAAFAQGPGGPGGPGGPSGFQPSPQMRAQFQAWRAWRDKHPSVMALGQTLRGLEEIEQDPSSRLNKAQAKTVLAVLKKWKDKPSVTDAEAQTISKELITPLNAPQKANLANAMQRRGFGGGPGGGVRRGFGGPGNRPGGFGGPGGRPGMAMQPPHGFNPLNPRTLPFPPMRDRAAQAMSQFIGELKATK